MQIQIDLQEKKIEQMKKKLLKKPIFLTTNKLDNSGEKSDR